MGDEDIRMARAALDRSAACPCAGASRAPLRAAGARNKGSFDGSRSSLLGGAGLELALAAELNHYPGPLHALELAAPLQLTAEQKDQTEKVRAAMLGEAKKLGRLIVEKEKELDGLFASGRVDDGGLRTLVGESARLQGELRVAHLMRHLEMKRILTPQQVKRYDELRGYAKAGAGHEGHGKE